MSAAALWGVALTAGGPAWYEYGRLFDESKLVHVTSVDFCLLTAFAPFWMYNDAQLRGWEPRCAANSDAELRVMINICSPRSQAFVLLLRQGQVGSGARPSSRCGPRCGLLTVIPCAVSTARRLGD